MKEQLRIKRFLGRAGGEVYLRVGPASWQDFYSLCCLDGNASFPDSAFQLYQLVDMGYLRAFSITLSHCAVASKDSEKIHWLVLTA